MSKIVIEIPDEIDMYKICWEHYHGIHKISSYNLSLLCISIMAGKVLSDSVTTTKHIEQINK